MNDGQNRGVSPFVALGYRVPFLDRSFKGDALEGRTVIECPTSYAFNVLRNREVGQA